MCFRRRFYRFFFFFFQAEDGIRDDLVTGVQTCALPIYAPDWEGRAMMTTAHAVIASGILTLLMLLVGSAFCAKAWTPPGAQIAFGNREDAPPALGPAARADRAAKNMLEGMVLLLAAALAAQIAGKTPETALGATGSFQE